MQRSQVMRSPVLPSLTALSLCSVHTPGQMQRQTASLGAAAEQAKASRMPSSPAPERRAGVSGEAPWGTGQAPRSQFQQNKTALKHNSAMLLTPASVVWRALAVAISTLALLRVSAGVAAWRAAECLERPKYEVIRKVGRGIEIRFVPFVRQDPHTIAVRPAVQDPHTMRNPSVLRPRPERTAQSSRVRSKTL
jgi:hypothetical protein